jgi:hypothetical protein
MLIALLNLTQYVPSSSEAATKPECLSANQGLLRRGGVFITRCATRHARTTEYCGPGANLCFIFFLRIKEI